MRVLFVRKLRGGWCFAKQSQFGREVGFVCANAERVRRRGLGLIVQKTSPYRSFAGVVMVHPAVSGLH